MPLIDAIDILSGYFILQRFHYEKNRKIYENIDFIKADESENKINDIIDDWKKTCVANSEFRIKYQLEQYIET